MAFEIRRPADRLSNTSVVRRWATLAAVLVTLVIGCASPDDSVAQREGEPAPQTSTPSTTSSTGNEALPTKAALAGLRQIMSPETFGAELIVTPRTCPVADADAVFRQVAQQLPDDDVVRTLRDGLPDTLLMSLPGEEVSVASCMVGASVPSSTIQSVRLEVRPARESIESLLDLTTDPDSVTVQQGQPFRGGAFYQYCGTRPEDARKVCASGWRNADLDIALTFVGVEADLVDLAAAENVLAGILDDVVEFMAT